MCGRFFLVSQASEAAALFGLEEVPPLQPQYNIAPTQNIAVVREVPENRGARTLSYMRWGLVPAWTKDASQLPLLINARSETVHEKPAFKAAFKKRHCAIPANGFFEWARRGKVKQPYVIQLKGRRLFALAGLWEAWQQPDGSVLESCAILTTAANEVVSPLHDRMPVILYGDHIDVWLGPVPQDQEVWKELFRPAPSVDMVRFPVTQLVNNPKYDAPQCIEPIQLFDES
ncbi:MAG: SOS response-associated peptidase [Desulfomonilaceae bacterium]